jgi:uncharacterized membrane protein YphA (DoxX/SURF4 family)
VNAVRTIARPMLGVIFIVSGVDVLRNPGSRAEMARPVVERVASLVPIAPADPETAVTLIAMVHLGAGGMLTVGVLPRLAALALAASMVPTTLAGHRFWEIQEQPKRSQQRTQFLKNTAILGGLLIAALD